MWSRSVLGDAERVGNGVERHAPHEELGDVALTLRQLVHRDDQRREIGATGWLEHDHGPQGIRLRGVQTRAVEHKPAARREPHARCSRWAAAAYVGAHPGPLRHLVDDQRKLEMVGGQFAQPALRLAAERLERVVVA